MSLFSTIAHDGPVPARGLPNRMWMIAAGLALAAIVGLVIVNNTAAEPLETATMTHAGPAHDEFVRINTTALDALVPAAAAVESQDVDSFIYLNTTALDALAPAAGASEIVPTNALESQIEFLTEQWNARQLEYSEQSNGPR